MTLKWIDEIFAVFAMSDTGCIPSMSTLAELVATPLIKAASEIPSCIRCVLSLEHDLYQSYKGTVLLCAFALLCDPNIDSNHVVFMHLLASCLVCVDPSPSKPFVESRQILLETLRRVVKHHDLYLIAIQFRETASACIPVHINQLLEGYSVSKSQGDKERLIWLLKLATCWVNMSVEFATDVSKMHVLVESVCKTTVKMTSGQVCVAAQDFVSSLLNVECGDLHEMKMLILLNIPLESVCQTIATQIEFVYASDSITIQSAYELLSAAFQKGSISTWIQPSKAYHLLSKLWQDSLSYLLTGFDNQVKRGIVDCFSALCCSSGKTRLVRFLKQDQWNGAVLEILIYSFISASSDEKCELLWILLFAEIVIVDAASWTRDWVNETKFCLLLNECIQSHSQTNDGQCEWINVSRRILECQI